MYAIFKSGSHQYKAEVGEVIDVQLLPEEQTGAGEIEFDNVLALHDGNALQVGTPTLAKAKVTATVEGTLRGPKQVSIKFLRRTHHLTRKSHRQSFTRVRVTAINTN